MIVTWHEVWGKEYWQKYLGGIKGTIAYWIERMSVRLPDTIISVSDHTTKALRHMVGESKEIITIPNGLNITEISANSPAKIGGADVIFAGRLLSHKNIDVLIYAVSILIERNPNISLSIIGEGPEKPKLKILASELGIKNNVSFQDFFEDHNDLYSLMQASGVFVLPSTREGFGIVVLEANACGLPVITVNHKENAAKELVTEGQNGMVTSLDKNEMADAIEKMLNEENRRDYNKYIEKYDWSHIISKILKVYNYKNV
jgi:glycosyltransferase involved in cell wall biosynthesis